MSPYNEQTRHELQRVVMNSGMKPDRAREAVDLACHAADEAVEKLTAVINRAPDLGIGLTAFELTLQLAITRMQGTLDRTHTLGAAMGASTAEALVQVPR